MFTGITPCYYHGQPGNCNSEEHKWSRLLFPFVCLFGGFLFDCLGVGFLGVQFGHLHLGWAVVRSAGAKMREQ